MKSAHFSVLPFFPAVFVSGTILHTKFGDPFNFLSGYSSQLAGWA